MKLENKLVIRKSKEPEGKKTHVLWHESESFSGYGCKGIFKGTYQECLKEKEKLMVSKPKQTSYAFRLLRKALHRG